MSVRIARLRSGEDIIADIKEVVDKDQQDKIAAIQLDTPYMVGLEESIESMFSDDGTSKISSPKVRFFPWVPLSKNNFVYLDPNEIICIYEAVDQVLEKYESIREAINHGRGNDTADQVATAQATGAVPDWEGN